MNIQRPGKKSSKDVVPIGKISIAPDVPAVLAAAGVTAEELIERHRCGDWGMVDDEDQEYQDWRAAHEKAVTSTFVVWAEGKAKSVFITTEAKTTHVVLI